MITHFFRFVRLIGGKWRFYFIIRLSDGYQLDVICKDSDAEEFLGVSAQEYYQNTSMQSNLLKELINHKAHYINVALKVYSTKSVIDENVESPPRVGIFKTKAPFSIR